VTSTIGLAPELQPELARQAATRGVGIQSYAARLIEDAAWRATADSCMKVLDRLQSGEVALFPACWAVDVLNSLLVGERKDE